MIDYSTALTICGVVDDIYTMEELVLAEYQDWFDDTGLDILNHYRGYLVDPYVHSAGQPGCMYKAPVTFDTVVYWQFEDKGLAALFKLAWS